MNKAFPTIFKNMGVDFLPAWQALNNFYDSSAKSEDPMQRQWAICIFDDVLEFCGPHSFQYYQQIAGPFADGIRDANANNR